VFLRVLLFPLSLLFHRRSTLTLIYPHVGLTRTRNWWILGTFQTAIFLPASGSLNGKYFQIVLLLNSQSYGYYNSDAARPVSGCQFHTQTVPTSNTGQLALSDWLISSTSVNYRPLSDRNFRPNSFQINIITLRDVQIIQKFLAQLKILGVRMVACSELYFEGPQTLRVNIQHFSANMIWESRIFAPLIVLFEAQTECESVTVSINWVCECDSANKLSVWVWQYQ
jgi:hypothetical protein